jgi:hypothetical protein
MNNKFSRNSYLLQQLVELDEYFENFTGINIINVHD